MAKRKTGIDARKLKELTRRVRAGGLTSVYNQWGTRYLTWTRRRFKKNSKGGGEWPPLSPVTLTYRRVIGSPLTRTKGGRKRSKKAKAKFKEKFSGAAKKAKILIDTGVLFKSLTEGAKGNLFQKLNRGIRVGFSNTKVHKGRSFTIRQLAMWHQVGSHVTNLPARPILHNPDSKFKIQMVQSLAKGIRKIIKEL